MATSHDHAMAALPPRRSVSHGNALLVQHDGGDDGTPPKLPPRRRSSFGQIKLSLPPSTPPPLPARPRTLYPSSAGPRLPSTFTQVRQAAAARARQYNGHQTTTPPPSAYKPPAVMAADEDDRPVDIRARVAAFENFNSGGAGPSRPVPAKRTTPVPPPPPPRHASPASFSGGQDISRVSSAPRSRPGDEPTPRSAPEPDPLAEFGALSPQMRFGGARSATATQSASLRGGYPAPPSSHLPPSASASLPISSSSSSIYSGSPHGSASLSPVSAHRVPAPLHHHGSSPNSAFDLYASSAGAVRRQASGTSLRDLTNASLARAVQHQHSSRHSSPGMASDQFPGSVSGKVPLPNVGPSSLSRRGSPSPHRMASSPTMGRESPAPPPPPARNFASSLYARTSGSSPQLVPAQTPARHAHHRSSISSSSSSAASATRSHLLEDDDDDASGQVGYGLSLHPALQPTASPVSSRAPSRASMSRSAPASPKGTVAQLLPGDTSQSTLAAPSAHVRLHPPTPSPERRPAEVAGVSPSHTGSRTRSMDSSSSQDHHMSTSPTVNYAIRKKGPALPPRGGLGGESSDVATSPPVSYTPYNPARRASGGSVGVASKVPLPPKFPSSGSNVVSTSPFLQRSTPAPAPLIPPRPTGVRIRHTSSQSTGSSPAQSPLPSPGHRVTKSGPGPAGLTDWPSTGGGGQTLQPPPTRTAMTRTRSSSMGPSGSAALPTRKTGASGKAPANVFHGSRAYQTAALARSSPPSTLRSRGSSGRGTDAKPTPPTSRSLEPRDESARKRYEALWEREIARASRGQRSGRGRKASATRGGGVASLAQQFEGMRGSSDDTPSVATPTRLSPHQVSQIWSRSHLRADVLSQVWEAAVAYERQNQQHMSHGDTRGLSKESFIRSIAAIDAELEYRSERRKWKERRRGKVPSGARSVSGGGVFGSGSGSTATPAVHRRVPPPAS